MELRFTGRGIFKYLTAGSGRFTAQRGRSYWHDICRGVWWAVDWHCNVCCNPIGIWNNKYPDIHALPWIHIRIYSDNKMFDHVVKYFKLLHILSALGRAVWQKFDQFMVEVIDKMSRLFHHALSPRINIIKLEIAFQNHLINKAYLLLNTLISL